MPPNPAQLVFHASSVCVCIFARPAFKSPARMLICDAPDSPTFSANRGPAAKDFLWQFTGARALEPNMEA